MAGIAARRGSEILLRLARQKEVQPEGKQVAMAILAAADKAVKDPARITRLINELGDADSGKRQIAANDLAQTGVDAVVPLITALGDPARAKDLLALENALVPLKVVSEGPLLAASIHRTKRCESTPSRHWGISARRRFCLISFARRWIRRARGALRKAATDALKRIADTVPTVGEAERYLDRRLKAFLAEADVLSQDLADVVEIWKWDAAQKCPSRSFFPKATPTCSSPPAWRKISTPSPPEGSIPAAAGDDPIGARQDSGRPRQAAFPAQPARI